MSTSKCPQCGEMIENDSLFCDQCGAELYICPQCHIIGKGKGKRCGQCGKELVAATSLNGCAASNNAPSTPPPATTPAPASVPPAPATSPTPARVETPNSGLAQQASSTMAPGGASYNAPSALVCAKENIRLPLIDNAIIGRGQGNYGQYTAGLMYMSRTHAMLRLVNGQWSITDMNSTNGTKVNGVKCSPCINISKGDIVTIANSYEFRVE